jgi:hypothetical protein
MGLGDQALGVAESFNAAKIDEGNRKSRLDKGANKLAPTGANGSIVAEFVGIIS